VVAGEADLAGLEAERARLYAELGEVGDFRRGTLSAVFRSPSSPSRTWGTALGAMCRRMARRVVSVPKTSIADWAYVTARMNER